MIDNGESRIMVENLTQFSAGFVVIMQRSHKTGRPSIFYTRLMQLSGRGGAGAYPSRHWAKRRGTPWTSRQSITGPHRDK